MPTAARLVSAIAMVALAWFVSDMVTEAMLLDDPDQNFGNFKYINLGIAALLGWRLLGSRVGNDYSVSIGLGLTAVAALVFWCVLAHAFIEMFKLSIDRRFDGPMEAIVGAIALGVEYASELGRTKIIVVLVGSGILLGPLAEHVSRRWR